MQKDHGWAEWGWDLGGQFVAGIATESRVVTKRLLLYDPCPFVESAKQNGMCFRRSYLIRWAE